MWAGSGGLSKALPPNTTKTNPDILRTHMPFHLHLTSTSTHAVLMCFPIVLSVCHPLCNNPICSTHSTTHRLPPQCPSACLVPRPHPSRWRRRKRRRRWQQHQPCPSQVSLEPSRRLCRCVGSEHKAPVPAMPACASCVAKNAGAVHSHPVLAVVDVCAPAICCC